MLSQEFVLAGRATFTVANNKGQRYTYRVTHKKANGNYGETWFIGLLTGPDNTSDYTYLGKMDANGVVTLTRGSKFNDNSKPVAVVSWALEIIWRGFGLPDGYSITHCGRCGRCGRLLTVPESVESGLGPECIKMMAFA